jgi:hypothetical integral membrane protein (TIGR02206 family)
MESFFIPNGNFVNYTTEHYVTLTFWVLFSVVVLLYGRYKWSEEEQKRNITLLLIIAAGTQIMKIVIKNWDGSFDITKDLPLHLCNMLPFAMIWVMWQKNRKWWAFFFFWIVGGSSHSLVTTSLTESFPHHENIRYWVLHSILVMSAFYGSIVYGFRLEKKDIYRSWFGMNVLAAILFPVNVLLGSNYVYLNGKPPGKTFYDLLGPWPYYLITLEVIIPLLFWGIYILFHTLSFSKKKEATTSSIPI